MIGEMTFRQLEREQGGFCQELAGSSPLDEWYKSVRDKPLADFSDDDLGIALRQRLFLDCLLPVVATRIETDPLAGALYDGELLASLKYVPQECWSRLHSISIRIKNVITSNAQYLGSDLRDDIAVLLEKVSKC
jgi:hypothetical protein